MPSAKPEWTSAINVRRERMSRFNADGKAWKLLWSAAGPSITQVELRLLRRLAESRRRASFLGAVATRTKAAPDGAAFEALRREGT